MATVLRDYQKEAIKAVYSEFRQAKRVLLQLPTGGGKTTVFSQIVKDFTGRRPDEQVMLVAHRRELITQMWGRLGEFGIPSWPVYDGRPKAPDYPVQCASVQTLAAQRDEDWPRRVGLVVIDEAHHCSGENSYNAIFERYPEAFVLGVSATPCRLDGRGLDSSFERIVCGPSTWELIERGYLCPYRFFRGSHPDTKGIRTSGGDYQSGALAKRCLDATLLGDLVQSWREICTDKRTIVFGVNVEHSLSIVERYQQAGIPAEHVDGNTPKQLRTEILNRFKTGETLVLANVGIVTEGFDLPACEAVQLARPTKSLSLYLQMVGRALRIAEGKQAALILDHGNNFDEHGLPCDRHVWTLEGVQKRQTKYSGSEPEVPKEAAQKETEAAIILEDKTAKMVEISRGDFERIDQIVIDQEIKGYKKVWAFYRILEVFGSDLKLDYLKYLAKKLGYHYRWAIHKWQEIQDGLHQPDANLVPIPVYQQTPKPDPVPAFNPDEWEEF